MIYILASHGDYAKATVKSCAMITGALKNMYPISFQDPMSVQNLVEEYQKAFDFMNSNHEQIAIITDIRNGTPANAAMLFHKQHPSVRIYSGLSLSLLLALALGTPIENAIEENKELMGEIKLDTQPRNLQSHEAEKENSPDGNKQAVPDQANPTFNVRIDERLIHGQVATMWTRKLNITRIMIIDDGIISSDIQKMTLKTAVPKGVHLSILSIEGAAKRIKSGKYYGQNIFMIVKNPNVLMNLVKLGVKVPQINVGNMSMKTNAVQIAKSVAVTAEDISAFKYLDQNGCRLYHQMVPNDNPVDFMQLLSRKGQKA